MQNLFGFVLVAAVIGGFGYFVVWPKLKAKFAKKDGE